MIDDFPKILYEIVQKLKTVMIFRPLTDEAKKRMLERIWEKS